MMIRKPVQTNPLLSVAAIAALVAIALPCCREGTGDPQGSQAGAWQIAPRALAGNTGAARRQGARLEEENRPFHRQPASLPKDPQNAEEPRRKEVKAEEPSEQLEGQSQGPGAEQGEPAPAAKVQALEEALRALKEKTGRAAEQLQRAASAAYQADRYETALPMLTCAVELGSDDPRTLFRLAYCLARARDYAGARERYTSAITKMEKEPAKWAELLKKACNNCGAALARLKDALGALRLYEKAIALDENYAPTYFNLGLLYEKQLQDAEAAIKAYRRHIALAGSRSMAARAAIIGLQQRKGERSRQKEQ